MKKVIFLICFILFLSPFKIFGENIQTPAELITCIKKAYENINSYSYTNEQGEYDTLTKEIQKEARKNYSEENKKYCKEETPEVSDKPEYKKGIYEVEFYKPYDINVEIDSSDYTPSILNGVQLIYKPDEDPNNFAAKVKILWIIPITFHKDVQEEVTGDFLVMNWTVDLLQLDYYLKNGESSISSEQEKIDGRDTYLLEFKFPQNIKPSVPEYDLGGIPTQAKHKVDYTLAGLENLKYSSVKFWVDKNDFIIIKREEYIDDKLHASRIFKDIKLNNLCKDDI